MTGVAHASASGESTDLVEAAVRHDGEPVGLEDGEEGLVRLGDRHLLRREDRRLDVVDLAPEDEPLARQLADDPHELGEVGVLEGEGDLVALVARRVLDARLELTETRRVGLLLPSRGGSGGRGRLRRSRRRGPARRSELRPGGGRRGRVGRRACAAAGSAAGAIVLGRSLGCAWTSSGATARTAAQEATERRTRDLMA